MAWYDKNPNWVKEAVNKALELEINQVNETIDITKTAFDVGIGSGAIIGGLVGNALGREVAEQRADAKYKQIYANSVAKILNEQNKKLIDMSNDYYTQIENIEKDLKILFTPVTVVYILKNTVIETISTDTMSSAMKDAWRRRDKEYFKNYLINKVYLDAFQAEQTFIRKLIEQDKELKKAISKKSSDFAYVEDIPDMHLYEVVKGLDNINKLFKKAEYSDSLKKYANTLIEATAEWEESIPVELGTLKYSSDIDFDLGLNKLAFLWFGKQDPMEMDFLSPGYLKKNMAVVYLPDRVLYVTDNVVVSQLNVTGMNEDDYSQFKDRNSEYFKTHFFTMAKKAGFEFDLSEDEDLDREAEENLGDDLVVEGLEEATGGQITALLKRAGMISFGNINPPLKTPLRASEEKLAAIADTNSFYKELFTKGGIHPKIYYLFLMDEFNDEWLSWDNEVLLQSIQDVFNVEPSEIVQNKLMSMVLVLHSDAAFTGYHTFEKVVRSFNDKLINWELRESNLSLGEFVNAMRIMSDLISDMDGNIYDNFSEHVLGYLVEVLMDQGYRVCAQKTASRNEKAFWDLVNLELLENWIRALPNGLLGTSEDKAKLEAKGIQRLTKEICDLFRGNLDIPAITEEIKNRAQEFGLTDKVFTEILLDNVVDNLAVDVFLEDVEKRKNEQIKQYIGK